MNPLQWLGGADPEVLERTPSAGRTTAALGGTVLTTGVMAMAAFALAIHDWLHLPTAVAVAIGVAWGLAIMNLDRWLLLASRRQSKAAYTIALAVPRVLLAVAIGFVIAEPLVLRVFDSDVARQVQSDRQEQRAARLHALEEEYDDIPGLEAREAKLERALTAAPDAVLAGNPDYDAAKADLDRAQDRLVEAQKDLGCEAQGSCGTHKAGCGPVCIENKKIVAQRREGVQRAQAALAAVTGRLTKASKTAARQNATFASDELKRVQKKLTERRADEEKDRRQILDDFTQPVGLIDRETALDHLSSENAVVGSTIWLFRLFLLAVDITPILFKTLLLLGAKSPYERTQEQLEEHEQVRLKIVEDAEDKAQDVAAALIAEEAEIQADKRREALRDMHEEIAKVEREVWREQIEDWKQRVLAARSAAAPGSTSPSPATSFRWKLPRRGHGGGRQSSPAVP